MINAYTDLHIHSEYSLSDSILRIPEIIAHAKQQQAEAIALTDRNNIYGAIKFYKAARAAGIKPILGCDLSIRDYDGHVFQLVLLAQHQQGFIHLCELISDAYQYDQKYGEIAVNIDRLTTAQCRGLIALSGAMQGDLAVMIERGHVDEASRRAAYWQSIFADRYYLQIAKHGFSGESAYIAACQRIGQQHGIAAVATNLSCFGRDEQDFEVHEIRVCISGGYQMSDPKRPRNYTVNHHLLTQDEATALFKDTPQLLHNSAIIARRCNTQLTLGKNYLPDFPLPDGQSVENYLIHTAQAGLAERLICLFPDEAERQQHSPEYHKRLAAELEVINQMGFPGYFLIVADFIKWAKAHDIPVGPGRGSGAGSLVAYALKITDLDPMAYDLLFERFLNPERVSMPDFDVDFCMEKRDHVIDYVAEKYGRDKVSQIATYGTMAAKAVIRDVGRVMGMPYPVVDRLSKMVPNVLKIKLLDTLGKTAKAKDKPEMVSEELIAEYENNNESRQLLDTCLRLEGLVRNVGKHAGGVVIAPTKLTDFSAIYAENAGASISCQFDKDDIEAAGLVKFDFLGLRTLTVIDWAMAHVNKRRYREGLTCLVLEQIPLDDAPTYDLLKSGQTTGVFQLESRGMKELILKLKPDNFEDIIALVALFRPGPLQSGMVDDFIRRKHGLEEVSYPHPALKSILDTTYGVMVYQEQVMQVAQVLAKYSLGEADILRRAMGKKKEEEMIKQRGIFTSRAEQEGVDSQIAAGIFDLMAKFAEYGFNKSHSAAYALLSYQTAWLKKHYPAEFLAAVLTSEMDHTDKIVRFIDECAQINIKVLPPCINRSQYAFSVDKNGAIVYGLGAVKGVGESAIDVIIRERETNGDYLSLSDICQRLNLKKLNRKTLETLIYAGAFDRLHANRGGLFATLPEAIRLAEQFHKDAQSQQADMFGLFSQSDINNNDAMLKILAENAWNKRQQLEYEKNTLGLYLSDHPINTVAERLKAICHQSIAELVDDLTRWEIPRQKGEGYEVLFAGLVTDIRKMISKRGNPMAFLTLDDRSGRCECSIFGDLVKEVEHLLQVDNILIIRAKTEYVYYRQQWQLSAQSIVAFEQAQYDLAKGFELFLTSEQAWEYSSLIKILDPLKTNEKGLFGSITIKLVAENIIGTLKLSGRYQLDNKSEQALCNLFGDKSVHLLY